MATTNNKAKAIEIIEPKSIWVGPAQAPVNIVWFGDYESEECAKANTVIEKLMAQFEGQIRFNFRHFPLTQVHQYAQKAAEASVAAAQEGKFAEMHQMLFNHRRRLGSISLKGYAKEVGVTDKNFLTKLVDSFYGWTVRADLLEGLNLGIRSVPAVLINDKLYSGRITFPELSKAVEAELAARRRKRA